MAKYLDETGVARLWTKIKAYVADNATAPTNITGNAGTATKLQYARAIDGVTFDGAAARHHYGTCTTSAVTTAKTTSITGFSLTTGAKIAIRFTYGITATNPTLNVSGTGAKPIYYRSSYLPAGYVKPYAVVEMVYSGSYWYIIGDLAQEVSYLTCNLAADSRFTVRNYTATQVGKMVHVQGYVAFNPGTYAAGTVVGHVTGTFKRTTYFPSPTIAPAELFYMKLNTNGDIVTDVAFTHNVGTLYTFFNFTAELD